MKSTETLFSSLNTQQLFWGRRDRTFACRFQRPMPYHLAIPQKIVRTGEEGIEPPSLSLKPRILAVIPFPQKNCRLFLSAPGFEPGTRGLKGRRSTVELRTRCCYKTASFIVLSGGIEPPFLPWKGSVLPLDEESKHLRQSLKMEPKTGPNKWWKYPLPESNR
jgi:hypothetical protein